MAALSLREVRAPCLHPFSVTTPTLPLCCLPFLQHIHCRLTRPVFCLTTRQLSVLPLELSCRRLCPCIRPLSGFWGESLVNICPLREGGRGDRENLLENEGGEGMNAFSEPGPELGPGSTSWACNPCSHPGARVRRAPIWFSALLLLS